VNERQAAQQKRDQDQASDEGGRGTARRGCPRRMPIGEMRCTLCQMDGDNARPRPGYRPGGRQGDRLRKCTDRAIIVVAMVGVTGFREAEIIQRPARLKPGRDQRILRSTWSRRMTKPQNSQSQRDQRGCKAVQKGMSQTHVIPVRLRSSLVNRDASTGGRARWCRYPERQIEAENGNPGCGIGAGGVEAREFDHRNHGIHCQSPPHQPLDPLRMPQA
jgi:hypothetical protein